MYMVRVRVRVSIRVSIRVRVRIRVSVRRQTRTSFVKLRKVCSIEHLTAQIKLVLLPFKSWTVHKIIEYLTLGLLSSL